MYISSSSDFSPFLHLLGLFLPVLILLQLILVRHQKSSSPGPILHQSVSFIVFSWLDFVPMFRVISFFTFVLRILILVICVLPLLVVLFFMVCVRSSTTCIIFLVTLFYKLRTIYFISLVFRIRKTQQTYCSEQ